MRPRRVLERIEAAERTSGTKPRQPHRQPKMTTSENREACRAFVREYIFSNPGVVVGLHLEALHRRQEEQRTRGFKVDADPTIAAVLQSVSNGFVHEPDQAAIVAAAETWIASLGIEGEPGTAEFVAAVTRGLAREAVERVP